MCFFYNVKLHITTIKQLKQDVATLALGSRPTQGLAKVQAKREIRESHFMLPKVQESVKE
jgi:hypothetical protein